MSADLPSDRTQTEIAALVGDLRRDIHDGIDSCFAHLRAMRMSVNARPENSTAGDGIRQLRASFAEKFRTGIYTALGAEFDRILSVLDGAGPSAQQFSALSTLARQCRENLSELHECCAPFGDGADGHNETDTAAPDPRAALRRRASIHLTRLVAIVQARDSIDQRMQHITDGLAIGFDAAQREQGVVLCIVKAQLQSVGDTLVQLADDGAGATGQLSTLFQAIAPPNTGQDIATAQQFCRVFSDAKSNLDAFREIVEILPAAMPEYKALQAATAEVSQSIHDHLEQEWGLVKQAQADLFQMAGSGASADRDPFSLAAESAGAMERCFHELGGLHGKVNAVAERLDVEHKDPQSQPALAKAAQTILNMYTMDEEREVHRKALSQFAA